MDKPNKLKFSMRSDFNYARDAKGNYDLERGTVHVSLMLNQSEVYVQEVPFEGYGDGNRACRRGFELVEMKLANVLGRLMAAEPEV